VAGVWVGNDDNSPTNKVTGGSLPADIWRDVMEVAHAGLPSEPLPGDLLQNQEPQVAVSDQGDVFMPPDENGYPQPQRNNGGFLDSIQEMFGGSRQVAPQADGGGRNNAYERMQRRKKD
jgi:penicillin-binding protein 1A